LRSRFSILAAGMLALVAGGAAAQSADIPRTEFLGVQDREFQKMDADKNGQVTRAEAEAYQRATAIARARATNQALFAQLDKDRNGSLSPAEFAALNAGAPQVDGRTFITQLDTDKNGQVSLVEHRAGKLNYFDKIDLDKNGIVTAAEMRAAGVIK
jgi:Ca2+-binding EF-hand superfamily protein